MGGISIALSDPISLNLLNPAGLYQIGTTQFTVQYFYEHNRYRAPEGSAASQYSNFNGFAFAVPFGSGMGLAFGLTPVSRMEYNLSFRGELAGEPYTKTVEGSGGLNHMSFSFWMSPIKKIGLGVSGHYVFGELREEWGVNYDRPDFLSSEDVFSTNNSGFSFTAGLIVRPVDALQLGAYYTPEVSLDNKTDTFFSFDNDKISEHEGSLTYPGSWGVGVNWKIGRSLRMGMDYLQTDWSQSAINELPIPQTMKTTRLAAGAEIQYPAVENTAFLKKIVYRFGFNYEPYLLEDPDGNTIKSWWGSIGFGIPVVGSYTRVDIALMLGRRGSISRNGLSETLFRLSLSLTGGERWFIRRY
jgi:long-subunit fatty acid transport protein